MNTIIIYILIMLAGVVLAKKNLIPSFFQKRLSKLQTISLIFLLFILGYKLGSDSSLLSSIHLLGLQSFIIAASAIVFSILFVFIFYKKEDR